MAWTKAKMAVVVGVGVLLAAGTTTLTVKKIQNHQNDNYPWQVENPTPDMFEKLPPMIKIVPTKFPNSQTTRICTSGPSVLGISARVQDVISTAYDANQFAPGHQRLWKLFLTKIPAARYDFIFNLPIGDGTAFGQELKKQESGDVEALQEELKNQLGIVCRRETITTNVFLLKVSRPNSPGLKPATEKNQVTPTQKPGEISFRDQGCRTLASALANVFSVPVLNKTGLTKSYYFDLKWNPAGGSEQSQSNLKQALLDQLGLELVPSREPVEMLVVEKVK